MRVFYLDEAEKKCSLPAGWTDVVPPDPFVLIAAGRSPFRVKELLELSGLIPEISQSIDERDVET
jgi:hypothetical protein